MLDLYEELGAAVGALDEARIEYALCRGLAMGVHGFVRAMASTASGCTNRSMPTVGSAID